MKLVTRAIKAASAAKRWNDQYGTEDSRLLDHPSGAKLVEVGRKLRSLGKTPKPDDVDAVIKASYPMAHNQWTKVESCDECNADGLDVVVMLGEEPDYESHTVFVCLDCLKKAVALAEGKR